MFFNESLYKHTTFRIDAYKLFEKFGARDLMPSLLGIAFRSTPSGTTATFLLWQRGSAQSIQEIDTAVILLFVLKHALLFENKYKQKT